MTATHIQFSRIDDASLQLRNGGVVAIPTETVYGLAACFDDENAIQNVFRLKGRPSDNPLIVHVSDLDQIDVIAAEVPEIAHVLIRSFFPGPLTLVLKKRDDVLDCVTGGLDSVAVRMPAHPIAKQLIEKVGRPLVAPSANISGKPSPTAAVHVFDDFGTKVDGIVDGGNCIEGIESTVVDVRDGECTILRPGSVTESMLEKAIGKPVLSATSCAKKPRSPGMKYRHYAPLATVLLFYSTEELKNAYNKFDGEERLILSNLPLSMGEKPFNQTTYYAMLRIADTMKTEKILIYIDPKTAQNRALMDRIGRSSSNSRNREENVHTSHNS